MHSNVVALTAIYWGWKAQSCIRDGPCLLCSAGLARRAVTLDGTWGILSDRSGHPSEDRFVSDAGMLGDFSDRHKKQVPNKNIPSYHPMCQSKNTKAFRYVKSQSMKINYFQKDFFPCSLQFSTYH